MDIELFATAMFIVQITHSIEELSTGFHKKWFLFKMPFLFFLTFEIVHNLFWLSVLLIKWFPQRETLLMIFIYLMLANGLEHIIWGVVKKHYVPGLITAPFHIAIFLIFYLHLI